MDITTKEAQPSPEQMQEYMVQWMDWMKDISLQGRLADGGNHLLSSGKVLRKGQIVDGPYVAHKESVAGYIIIHAEDEADAIRIAEQCPILKGDGTSVEIREAGN